MVLCLQSEPLAKVMQRVTVISHMWGKHLLLNCPEEIRQLFCECLTDANMKINHPCAKGKRALPFGGLWSLGCFLGVLNMPARPPDKAPCSRDLVLGSHAPLIAGALVLSLWLFLFHGWGEP